MVNLLNPDCLTPIAAPEFGLCDDQPNAPAYPSVDPNDPWIAQVKNHQKQLIHFYAIDKCLIIKDEQEKDLKRCDVLLKIDALKKLIFVELKDIKDPKKGNWRTEAIEQLEQTIALYQESHSEQPHKLEAHVAYPSKRNRTPTNYHQACKKFHRNHRMVLRIHPTITIK